MRIKKALAGAALSAGLVAASAGVATADHDTGPSFGDNNNASCVAVFVQTFAGPPGQSQRIFKQPRFGQVVSSVARTPKEFCRFSEF